MAITSRSDDDDGTFERDEEDEDAAAGTCNGPNNAVWFTDDDDDDDDDCNADNDVIRAGSTGGNIYWIPIIDSRYQQHMSDLILFMVSNLILLIPTNKYHC